MTVRRVLYPGQADTSVAPYSPGLMVDNTVYVSGQGPINFGTMRFELGSIESETRLTLRNVEAVLAEADCTLKDVVKATVHLGRIEDFEAFNRIYQEFFNPPYPARTTVQSVLGSGISVEVDVIAVFGCGDAGG